MQLLVKWSRRHFHTIADCQITEHPDNHSALLAEWTSLFRRSGIETITSLALKANTHYQLEITATCDQPLAIFTDLHLASNHTHHLLPLLPIQKHQNPQTHLFDFSTPNFAVVVLLSFFQRQGWPTNAPLPILLIEEVKIFELGPSPISSLWTETHEPSSRHLNLTDELDDEDDDGKTAVTGRTSYTVGSIRTARTSRTAHTTYTAKSYAESIPAIVRAGKVREYDSPINTHLVTPGTLQPRRIGHVMTGRVGTILKKIIKSEVPLDSLSATKYSLQRFSVSEDLIIDQTKNTPYPISQNSLAYPEIVQSILISHLNKKPNPGTQATALAYPYPHSEWPNLHMIRVEGPIDQQVVLTPRIQFFPQAMRPIYRSLIDTYVRRSNRTTNWKLLKFEIEDVAAPIPGSWTIEGLMALANGFGFAQRDNQTFWAIRDYAGHLHYFKFPTLQLGTSQIMGKNAKALYPSKFQPLVTEWVKSRHLGRTPETWISTTNLLTDWPSCLAAISGIGWSENELALRLDKPNGEVEIWQSTL